MKCPSCNENITIGNVDRCEYCGFMAPGARHFANSRSFAEWKSQTKLLDYGQDELFDLDPTVPDSSAEAQVETGSSTEVLSPFVPLKTPNKEKAANTASVVKPQSRTKAEPAAKTFKPYVPQNATNEAKVTDTVSVAESDPASKAVAPITRSKNKILKTVLFGSSGLLVLLRLVYFVMSIVNADRFGRILPNFVFLAIWIALLIACIIRKRKLLMTVGLVLLSVSNLVERIIYNGFDFSYFISYPEILIYLLEVFIPALLLLIKFRKKTARLRFIPGVYSIFCLFANIYVVYAPSVYNIYYLLTIIFFFVAGNYIHLLNENDSSVKNTADEKSVSDETAAKAKKKVIFADGIILIVLLLFSVGILLSDSLKKKESSSPVQYDPIPITQTINIAYSTILNREPTSDELQTWEAKLSNQDDYLEKMYRTLFSSEEFTNANHSNQEFYEIAYRSIRGITLYRDNSSDSDYYGFNKEGYISLLDNGIIDRNQLLDDFFDSYDWEDIQYYTGFKETRSDYPLWITVFGEYTGVDVNSSTDEITYALSSPYVCRLYNGEGCCLKYSSEFWIGSGKDIPNSSTLVIYGTDNEKIFEQQIPAITVPKDSLIRNGRPNELNYYLRYKFNSNISFPNQGRYRIKIYDNNTNEIYYHAYFYITNAVA